MLFRHMTCSSNLLRVHWANCKFVKFKIQTHDSQFLCWCFCFSIFDKIRSIRIHCSNCASCEVVFSLWNIRTNTTKILLVLRKVKTIDFFNSICSKRFMMKRFCMKKCQNRIWSIYSFWFCCIQNNLTKSADSNQILKILVEKTFAIVFAQQLYSYEINVKNLSCWLFEIKISWLEIWDKIAFLFSEDIIMNWFLYCDKSFQTFFDNAWW